MPVKFKVTIEYTFDIPDRGHYDYESYLNYAWFRFNFVDYDEVEQAKADGDWPLLDSWVAKAMALDYSERSTSCTASTYVKTEATTARQV